VKLKDLLFEAPADDDMNAAKKSKDITNILFSIDEAEELS